MKAAKREPSPACGRGQGEGCCRRNVGWDPGRRPHPDPLPQAGEGEGSLMTDRVLILDFGSQVTQLIARRVRESGVYCEIHPFTMAAERIAAFQPKAIILSGGPASVAEAGTPRAPQRVFEMGLPVLGICYGQMTMAAQLGGMVESSDHREF